MDFESVVRQRRMVRQFLAEPVDRAVIERCVDLASRAPSAGKTQGWNVVLVEGSGTARYWDLALPEQRRAGFGFPGLLAAPVLMIVCADTAAYLARYAEPDKASTGMGTDRSAWPAPYWIIDAAFATMVLLLALEDQGLGALFFAHASETDVRREFGIPADVEILGVIAVGHPDPGSGRRGASASRSRRRPDEIVHRDRW